VLRSQSVTGVLHHQLKDQPVRSDLSTLGDDAIHLPMLGASIGTRPRPRVLHLEHYC